MNPQFVQHQLAIDVYDFFCTHYVPWAALKEVQVIFVFGRKDAKFAEVASGLYKSKKAKVLVTGGIGKDSGDLRLVNVNIPEANFLAVLMLEQGVPGKDLLVEPTAKNGAENSRFGTKMIMNAEIVAENVVLVGHPATLLRLSAVHTMITREMGFTASYQLLPVNTEFYLDRESDQKLIIDECWRLYDYPQATHPNRETGKLEAWSDPIVIPPELLKRVLAWKVSQPK